MPDYSLPFPTRDLADKELTYDPCYAKIPEDDRPGIVESAWQKGVEAAKMVYVEQNGQSDFLRIAQASGLTCVFKDVDYVVGKQRYFSDYLSGKNEINLYEKSIALWAKQNQMTQAQAVNVILSHEFFHFLEWNRLGLTSRSYQVPMLILGPWRLGKTGIRALSEIGAHAFARTYYELVTEKETCNEATAL